MKGCVRGKREVMTVGKFVTWAWETHCPEWKGGMAELGLSGAENGYGGRLSKELACTVSSGKLRSIVSVEGGPAAKAANFSKGVKFWKRRGEKGVT